MQAETFKQNGDLKKIDIQGLEKNVLFGQERKEKNRMYIKKDSFLSKMYKNKATFSSLESNEIDPARKLKRFPEKIKGIKLKTNLLVFLITAGLNRVMIL